MPTPFPGMDPYLEQKGLWEEVHTQLIVALANAITPLIRPKYRVGIERRSYIDIGFIESPKDDLVGIPDIVVAESKRGRAVREAAPPIDEIVDGPLLAYMPDWEIKDESYQRYLEIREVATRRVITAIELLSPSNKRPGGDRETYEAKRIEILASQTHFVEIDLLRSGKHLPMKLPEGKEGQYRILVSRAHQRPRADVYAFALRQSIPDFPVPLLRGDAEPTVPLNQLVHEMYDRAGYDLAIDYSRPLKPPLTPEDNEWAVALLQPQK